MQELTQSQRRITLEIASAEARLHIITSQMREHPATSRAYSTLEAKHRRICNEVGKARRYLRERGVDVTAALSEVGEQRAYPDYRFYKDTVTPGNAIAVHQPSKADAQKYNNNVEGLAATFETENSPVSWTGISPDVLGDELKELEARKLHPNLFKRLLADTLQVEPSLLSLHL